MYRLKRFFKRNGLSFHKELFYTINPRNIQGHDEVQIQGLDIRLLKEDETEVLTEIWNVDLNQIKKRLEGGESSCYFTTLNGNPAAYHWIQFKGSHFIRPIGKFLKLQEGSEAVIYHTRVVEKFRGMGINKAVMFKMLIDFAKNGIEKAWIYTSNKNIAQQKSLKKMGFELYKKIGSLKVLGRHISISKL